MSTPSYRCSNNRGLDQRHGPKMETLPAIPTVSFSRTQATQDMSNTIYNRVPFLPEEFTGGDEETWARTDFKT